jgi:hypothetical protein
MQNVALQLLFVSSNASFGMCELNVLPQLILILASVHPDATQKHVKVEYRLGCCAPFKLLATGIEGI